GTFEFTVEVTDDNGFTATATVSITLNPVPTISTAPILPSATVDVAYGPSAITVAGGTAPLSFAVTDGALPAGLQVDPATGQIFGMPGETGTFTFTVTVTDAAGAEVELEFTLAVTSDAPAATGLGFLVEPAASTIAGEI